ncbi:type II secretion system GspH family protein [Vibrio sp. JC009]|uniref:PilW family protein n=1 Tax=Vibrio sp. JC009 TaxID=2912314 RepID=UPI0023B087CE|nr:type II secretion system protein [Vibrio sp. JC009]WED21540.1 type II secretion system GspH family protein [Vibrio sp. JC009]
MKRSGFTLIEMVMTIVVSGIIVLGITGFLQLGITGYSDTIARQKVQNQARFAIEKMSREMRHAVPNSFELNGSCLRFYPIKYSGFYTQVEAQSVANNTIMFMTDNQAVASADFEPGDRLVINPSSFGDLTSDTASAPVEDCDISCSENNGIYTISDTFSSYSVGNRHYIYGEDYVTYCLTSGSVTRAEGATGSAVTVADSLDGSSSFSYESPTLQRGGLVHMDLLFVNDDGEESSYKHDVQVLNVP